MMFRIISTLTILFILLTSCETEESRGILTEHVFIVVVDGARFSESWGDPEKKLIPNQYNYFSSNGITYNSFFNFGPTYTNAGHTALVTGNYQEIANNGSELPKNPSIFQYWLNQTNNSNQSAWVIASKDKLEILNNCKDSTWNNQSLASTNCGVNGLGTGYRHDTITYQNSIKILEKHYPSLVLINFREPDYSGHKNDWDGYLNGLLLTDELIGDLLDFIDNDPVYAGTTTIFITNDHGRHLDHIKNGFVSHGDNCDGCRHIMLLASGPDFRKGIEVETVRGMTDITATVAYLMQLDMPTGTGQVMNELFRPR
ncbi:alkaline phosphatase family protein [Reichenbachiella sp.]|uniref:alkaline phosphatase family protein n=1 Tax=Reichenbachiella sp. TaxID=2184521 RepID=UPI003BB02058